MQLKENKDFQLEIGWFLKVMVKSLHKIPDEGEQ